MSHLTQEVLKAFREGTLTNAYDYMGAHLIKDAQDYIIATRFTVYAPKAQCVHLVGEFNDYDLNTHPMQLIAPGFFNITIDQNLLGKAYKYAIKTSAGEVLYRGDPFAFKQGMRPETVSIVYDLKRQHAQQSSVNKAHKHKEAPISIYEVHLGSFMRIQGEFHTYRSIAAPLIKHLQAGHYTHVELLPLSEHPLDESWGYQVAGYYAATARYGDPNDLMALIDALHDADFGVIIDWVPAHMSKDEYGLYRFDGTPLYEYNEPHLRDNAWGTANFDLAKPLVRNYLISNALFWLKIFNIDGFRIDAVAHMLYHEGEQVAYQGSVAFFKALTKAVHQAHPNALLIAEDSSAYPQVTHPVSSGGLGFDYKWNMGWMNDTLEYFAVSPSQRPHHHHKLTFAMHYAYSEQYLNPLSHDEIVHEKKTLLEKMPGSDAEKFANFRLLLGFLYTHPGKKLLFMGQDFAQRHEWRVNQELDWHHLKISAHQKALAYQRELNRLYTQEKSLHQFDHAPKGFQWIDPNNVSQSVYSYIRKSENSEIIIAMNASDNDYHHYKIGVLNEGEYQEILNSDALIYGGNDRINTESILSDKTSHHHFDASISFRLPPLTLILFKRVDKP